MLIAEALMTYKHRMELISDTLDDNAASAKFRSLNELIRRATAALEKVELSNRRTAMPFGVGNIVAKRLEFVQKFLPDWASVQGDPAFAPGQTQTLQQWVEAEEREIKARIKAEKQAARSK